METGAESTGKEGRWGPPWTAFPGTEPDSTWDRNCNGERRTRISPAGSGVSNQGATAGSIFVQVRLLGRSSIQSLCAVLIVPACTVHMGKIWPRGT